MRYSLKSVNKILAVIQPHDINSSWIIMVIITGKQQMFLASVLFISLIKHIISSINADKTQSVSFGYLIAASI